VVVDRTQSVARKFGIAAHPATVIVDRKGIVRYVHSGFLKGDEVTLENSVKALLEGDKIARR
jgi:predicted transcriptional regulator